MKNKPVLVLHIDDKMKRGPKLDKVIASALGLREGPSYSVDSDAAWLIVTRLAEEYVGCTIGCVPHILWDDYETHHWECTFEGGPPVSAETQAHAICLAALHNQYGVVWA